MLVASGKKRLPDANVGACVLPGYEPVGWGLDDMADSADEWWEVALSGKEEESSTCDSRAATGACSRLGLL